MQESTNIATWLQPTIAAAACGITGYAMVGGWALPVGLIIGWVAYWRLHQLNQVDVSPLGMDTVQGRRTPRSSSWRDLPTEEQIEVAAEKEREGERRAARQVYWHLVHNNTKNPTPYRRLASMYREEENFPQLIHVLDHAIRTFQSTPAQHDPALNAVDLERAVSGFKRERERALQKNNAQFSSRRTTPSSRQARSGPSQRDT